MWVRSRLAERSRSSKSIRQPDERGRDIHEFLELAMAPVFIILATLTTPIFGQQTSGNLAGTIYDPTAVTVPGVRMTAHDKRLELT
jgi:hypothetical protein